MAVFRHDMCESLALAWFYRRFYVSRVEVAMLLRCSTSICYKMTICTAIVHWYHLVYPCFDTLE
jgi:hypothetical protein